MAISELDISHYLGAAQRLASRAGEAADETDRERRLPVQLAADMAREGLFRLLVPRSIGGAELDFPGYLKIVDLFARADASTAWCVNQNNVFATNAVRMPEETALEIWGDPLAVVSNGPPVASTRAVPVQGGYRVTGRWNFSSGIRHSTWVAALAPLSESSEQGRPAIDYERGIILLIPKGQVDVVDRWQVNGLRGTGSFSFEVKDLFVSAERSYRVDGAPLRGGSLYVIPTVLMFAAGFATVALGTARSALDAAMDIARAKTPVMRTSVLMHTSTTQRQIGQAEAIWRSARAFLAEAVAAVWDSATARDCLDGEERLRLRLAATHAIRTGAQVAAVAYDVAGSDGIFESNPIQRRLQDAQVITQQVQGRMTHYDTAGAFYLGLGPKTLF